MSTASPAPEVPEHHGVHIPAELAAIQAAAKAKADAVLLDALNRHAPSLIAGSIPAIVAQYGRTLSGGSSDPARVESEVTRFLAGPLAARFQAPAPEADVVARVVGRYRDKFKSDAAAEAFRREHALALAGRPEPDVVGEVLRLLQDRRSNEFLKTPIALGPRARRLAALMAPWRHQLATDEHELAESWTDLVDPMKPAMADVDLEKMVVARLGLPHNARHIRSGVFDPRDIRGERAGIRRPGERAEQQQKREPLFTI
jgi:hypothetical protein